MNGVGINLLEILKEASKSKLSLTESPPVYPRQFYLSQATSLNSVC